MTTAPQPWFQQACADVCGDKNALLTMKNDYAGTATGAASQAFLTKAGLLWEIGQTLSIGFISNPGVDTTQQQQKVQLTLTEWLKYTNVHFVFAEGAADINVANIRVTFDATSGSWGYIGKDAQTVPAGQATLNLGAVGPGSNVSLQERGAILHEFGHALGLIHEHQSPLQGGLATLKDDATTAYETYVQPTWTATDVSQQMNIYNKQNVSNYLQLDTTSIMRYFIPGQMTTAGNTILVTPSCPIGIRLTWSSCIPCLTRQPLPIPLGRSLLR